MGHSYIHYFFRPLDCIVCLGVSGSGMSGSFRFGVWALSTRKP